MSAREGGPEAGWCCHSVKYGVDDGEEVGSGSWALTAMLMSFDFLPRAKGKH